MVFSVTGPSSVIRVILVCGLAGVSCSESGQHLSTTYANCTAERRVTQDSLLCSSRLSLPPHLQHPLRP